MSTFTKYVRAIIEQAEREAQSDHSKTIEAQHVLLAIAARPEAAPGQVLSSAGLDRGALRDALNLEHEHSLSAAGVSVSAAHLPRSDTRAPAPTSLGASVRQALERGVAGVREQPRPAHLLLGILRAQVGTVPRALALAGIDRDALLVRVQQMLAEAGP
jgi:ATP-dependent Clp protease ATP-binding subunit ClpA